MKTLRLTLTAILLTGFTSIAVAANYPESGGRCAMGLAMKKDIPTDCDVTWQGPEGNKYCFGSKDVKKKFLDNSDKHISAAFKHYDNVVLGMEE